MFYQVILRNTLEKEFYFFFPKIKIKIIDEMIEIKKNSLLSNE